MKYAGPWDSSFILNFSGGQISQHSVGGQNKKNLFPCPFSLLWFNGYNNNNKVRNEAILFSRGRIIEVRGQALIFIKIKALIVIEVKALIFSRRGQSQASINRIFKT